MSQKVYELEIEILHVHISGLIGLVVSKSLEQYL